MKDTIPNRWYCVNNIGQATLCRGVADSPPSRPATGATNA